MKKLAALLLGIVGAAATLSATNPDFSHPQTTLQKAVRTYDTAIKTPDSQSSALIGSLLEIAGATAAIDLDSIVNVIPMIDKAAEACTSDPDKAMLLIMKAELINSVYSRNRWKYDRTETPDSPLPADMTEWNGRQFRTVIDNCAIKAFDIAANAPAKRLSSYQTVITADRRTLHFFPTVTDFVASKAVTLLNRNDDTSNAKAIVNRCISSSQQLSAPWFYWSVENIRGDNDALNKLYQENYRHEDSGYALMNIAERYSSVKTAPDWLIPSLRKFIARHPGYVFINNLKNSLKGLTRPNVTLSSKEIVVPGQSFDVNINHSFSKLSGFTIYKISEDAYRHRTTDKSQPVKSVSLATNANDINADTTVSVTIDRQGYYMISPTCDQRDSYNSTFFMAMPFIASYISGCERNAFVTVDYNTGAPLAGVNISKTIKQSTEQLGKTDNDGLLMLEPEMLTTRRERIDYGFSYEDGPVFNLFNGVTGSAEYSDYIPEKLQSRIFLERKLYHPGDTIRWMAVLGSDKGHGQAAVDPNRPTRIKFLNSNYQTIDTLNATTDAMGRISGSFIAPVDGLSGKYSIEIVVPNKMASRWSEYFTISDFKLPTFTIRDLSVKRDKPSSGHATIEGKAISYSGMPIADASVKAEIWQASRWRWARPVQRIGMIEATTDAKGLFSVVVPDSMATQSPEGCLLANITVTSPAGEAQTATKPFNTGKPYTIIFEGNNTNLNTDTPIPLPFAVYDADGNNVDIALRWNISKADDKTSVASGTSRSTKGATLNLSNISSGIYNLHVEAVDSSLAAPCSDIPSIYLYSIKNNTMPDQQALFVPETDCKSSIDGEATITFGVAVDEAFVYRAFGAGYRQADIEVERYDHGFHKIAVKIPDGETNARLIIFTTIDGISSSKTISITRPDRRKMKLIGSSMRHKLSPGQPERWTLRLTDEDGHPVSGSMVATMFNKALTSLSPYKFPSGFKLNYRTPNLRQSTQSVYNATASAWGKAGTLKNYWLQLPEFNPPLELYTYSTNLYMTKARSTSEGTNITITLMADDIEYEEYEEYEEEETFGLANSADIIDPEEDLSAATPYGQESQPDFEFRDAEVLQAFWMPELNIDENGETVISFTVPNANTTWSFNAFAWTSDLRSTNLCADLVAAKPVMVQPNLPRFLRSGDCATVLATVYNNTDSAASVTTVVELFDFSSGAVVSTASSTDTIAPSGSAIVSIDVNAGNDESAIGYRVRSTLGEFTDGEQAYIPVEVSTSDVIDSQVFYLNPGDADATLTAPKGNDMQSTLDYTANPAWNIIKQLPGLSEDSPTTATAASRQLFGAATAAGMLKTYPALDRVLSEWSNNPDSKALTSRLSQNEALKAAVLAETPWVQAAASDSHRMARLSLLFDRKATAANINSAIATLGKLQQSDGGWSWGEWNNRSSEWTTSTVLLELGRLRSAGFMPSDKDLKTMIDKAIDYYSSQLDSNVKTDRTLAMIAAMFPDHKYSLRATAVIEATLQQIITGWKSATTADKAVDAIILNASGYPSVAREVIGSLRQFAVSSPDKGISFPSVTGTDAYADLLTAFASVDPKAPEIDGMRQWLVIREQTTDLADPTRLIAAFAACGSNWLSASDTKTDITIGRSHLKIDRAELATGHIVVALPSDASGRRIKISRADDSVPAYGALISRYAAQSTEVKAASCADLSIEKRITVLRDGQWQYADDVRLGEQVRVLLSVKSARDLEYVTIVDGRPAAFQPVDQLPGWVSSGGARFYRENRDTETRLFINYLPKGTYQITVDMTASIAGTFSSGIATVQSQLSPSVTAHSAGSSLTCSSMSEH